MATAGTESIRVWKLWSCRRARSRSKFRFIASGAANERARTQFDDSRYGAKPFRRSEFVLDAVSIATVLLWGSWGLESKIIVDRISPWMNQVLFSMGLLPLLGWMLLWKNLRRATGVRKKVLGKKLSATQIMGIVLALAAVVFPLTRNGTEGLIPAVGKAQTMAEWWYGSLEEDSR
jgi:hypothetical protein